VLPALFLGIALGCGGGTKAAPKPPEPTAEEQAARSPVVSWHILAREPIANEAEVKHILIGWSELHGGDSRAAARDQAAAEAEVTALLEKLAAGANFEETMAASSEDQGSAASGQSFEVSPSAGLVIEFKQLSLRLTVGEIGVCQSQFGFHIIKRVK
jgi:PPIC-type PPIASE domain